ARPEFPPGAGRCKHVNIPPLGGEGQSLQALYRRMGCLDDRACNRASCAIPSHPMKTFPILSAAVLLAASSLSAVVPSMVEEQSIQNQSQHQGAPKVDVCFVLDTTGSMAGLIEAAKQKIWHIANQLAARKPTPQIRFALIGYRDRGDAYVTSLSQL